MSTRPGTVTIRTRGEREIEITRSFEASAALVWEAFTTPRYVMRWWGPSFSPMTACDIDFRVGGAWRYAMGRDDGELVFRGTYLEIDAPERLVWTESMDGMPGEVVNTLTLAERARLTTAVIVVDCGSAEGRDAMLESGMEAGIEDHYHQLDALLAAHDAPAEQFRRAAAAFSAVAHAVPADRWDDPSPCEGWSARDVVDHMVEWMPALLDSIGVPIAPVPDPAGDPAAAWDRLAAEIQAVLDDPVRSGPEVSHPHLGNLTVERAIGMTMTGDVLVHTWDVARATGGDETLPADLVQQQADGMAAMGDALEQSGQFGPVVPVPDDADVQTRMLALSGRRA